MLKAVTEPCRRQRDANTLLELFLFLLLNMNKVFAVEALDIGTNVVLTVTEQ